MSTPDDSQPPNLTSPLLEPSVSASFPPPISFVSSPRPLRDLPLLLLFLLLSLALFSFGIFSLVNHNPDHSCSPQNYNLANEYDNNYSLFVKNLSWTLTLTFLIAGPALVLLLLHLLRRFAKQVVYVSLPFLLLVPSLLNLYWFIACSAAPSCRHRFPLPYRILVLAFVFLLLALLLWILFANWRRIELTVKIIRVSAAALAENKALMLVLPMMTVGLLLYFVPVIVFLVFARWNGRAVVVGEKGECSWKQAGWVPAYYALAIVTMIWTAGVMVEAQVYVVSGTIAQWYFAEEGTRPRRSIRDSLRYIALMLITLLEQLQPWFYNSSTYFYNLTPKSKFDMSYRTLTPMGGSIIEPNSSKFN